MVISISQWSSLHLSIHVQDRDSTVVKGVIMHGTSLPLKVNLVPCTWHFAMRCLASKRDGVNDLNSIIIWQLLNVPHHGCKKATLFKISCCYTFIIQVVRTTFCQVMQLITVKFLVWHIALCSKIYTENIRRQKMKNDDIIVWKQYFPVCCTRSVVINVHCIRWKFISISKWYMCENAICLINSTERFICTLFVCNLTRRMT